MRLNSLRSRLFLSYVAVAGTVLLLVAVALFLLSLAPSTVTMRVLPTVQRLRAIGIGLEREVRTLPGAQSPESARQLLLNTLADTAAAHEGVRVLLLDRRRVVVYDSREAGWEGRRLPELQHFPGLFPDSGQDALAGRVPGPDGLPWLVYVQRLPPPTGERIEIVLAAPQTGGLAFFRTTFLPPLWRAALVALLLSLVLALLISRSVVRPLQRMAVATEAVAEGEYDQRLPLQGPDEVRRVAGSFNSMAARVKATQQAQRDFLINVSHDLKTPLTSIQGWSQALADGTAARRGQTEEAAQIIREETERMARMVSELLALARIDSGQLKLRLETVDLQALLEDVRRNLSWQADRQQIELSLRSEPVPPLQGDADRLMQVFTNLVDNALAYTPAGGRVRLALRPLGTDAVEVTVQDSGSGIPPEELERIFERFYQVEKSRARLEEQPRVGLGLAISRELVRAHGGEIYARSEMGQGTLFGVRLPLQSPSTSE